MCGVVGNQQPAQYITIICSKMSMYVFILLELNKLSKKSWAIVRLAPNSNVCRNINPSISLFSDLVITLGLSEARALDSYETFKGLTGCFYTCTFDFTHSGAFENTNGQVDQTLTGLMVARQFSCTKSK